MDMAPEVQRDMSEPIGTDWSRSQSERQRDDAGPGASPGLGETGVSSPDVADYQDESRTYNQNGMVSAWDTNLHWLATRTKHQGVGAPQQTDSRDQQIDSSRRCYRIAHFACSIPLGIE
ncbi:unnamed protein product [Lota lota]